MVNLNRLENSILRNLIYNEEYARKVLPFINAEYFSENIIKQKDATDIKQAYEFVKIKDGELNEQFGFDVDWENAIDI